jgi:hypothetical protein
MRLRRPSPNWRRTPLPPGRTQTDSVRCQLATSSKCADGFAFRSLKEKDQFRLVGTGRFELPTPWSRTAEGKISKCFAWCRLGASKAVLSPPQSYRSCTKLRPSSRLNQSRRGTPKMTLVLYTSIKQQAESKVPRGSESHSATGYGNWLRNRNNLNKNNPKLALAGDRLLMKAMTRFARGEPGCYRSVI